MTEDDRYPLPVLSDLLMNLGQGNTIFSSLDLLSGYWKVHMAPEARAITAFSTPSGHFECLRKTFGLRGGSFISGQKIRFFHIFCMKWCDITPPSAAVARHITRITKELYAFNKGPGI